MTNCAIAERAKRVLIWEAGETVTCDTVTHLNIFCDKSCDKVTNCAIAERAKRVLICEIGGGETCDSQERSRFTSQSL